jgi:phosphatidate cytidylyltransferase
MAIAILVMTTAGVLLGLDAAWPQGFVYAGCGIAAVAVALGEYAGLASGAGLPLDRSLLVLGGVLLFALQWAGWAAPQVFPDPWLVASAVPAAVCAGMLTRRVLRVAIPGALQAVGGAVLGLTYVPVLFGFLTAVRMHWGVAGLLTVLVVCKGSSTGAYLAGRSVGGPRLAPLLSPRKTVAGAVGQIGSGVLLAWVLSGSRWSLMGPGTALLFGAVVATAAMVGDLAESLLKRQAGVKDSGPMLPALGGMLDLVDDLLFAAPAAYVFLRCLELLRARGF